MKRNLLVALSGIFVFALLQMSSLKLTSNSAQPIAAGYAGDPGQTTCNNCHVGTSTVDATKFTIRLASDSAGLASASSIVGDSTRYVPNATHWMSITLNGTNGATPRYGFQLTSLDSLDAQAGIFTLVNSNTSLQSSNTTGRKYIGHRNATATTFSWSFKWTAPASGPVTFYYAGNIANGDGRENQPGDAVYEATSTITPDLHAGIGGQPSDIAGAVAYPLPFSHSLHTDLTLVHTAPLTITLLSMEGAVIRTLYADDASQGSFSRSFDLTDIATGVYFVRIQAGSSTQVIRTVKF